MERRPCYTCLGPAAVSSCSSQGTRLLGRCTCHTESSLCVIMKQILPTHYTLLPVLLLQITNFAKEKDSFYSFLRTCTRSSTTEIVHHRPFPSHAYQRKVSMSEAAESRFPEQRPSGQVLFWWPQFVRTWESILPSAPPLPAQLPSCCR